MNQDQHPAFVFDCIAPMPSAPAVLRVVLCQTCFENGDFGSMPPGEAGPHGRDRTWGVAEVESDDQGERHVTWEQTGLTLAEAERAL